MLKGPLFSNVAKKYSDIAILIFVTLLYIMICAESDMYVPAFPQMIDYFGISENKIQLVLSINFAGLCIAGLIAGPISDSYGRRATLIIGLLIFIIGSIGCVYTDNFAMLLFWRLLQGIATSVPMVIGAAMFFDKYTAEKAGKTIGVLNSFISASMAAAPIIGAWISEAFNWRANFVVILLLGIISFIAILLIIEETLQEDKRKRFNIKEIFQNYGKVLKSFPFIIYSIMAIFAFTTTVVYIANLSVIFINHIGMTLEVFSYYQASTMLTFIIFSLLSVKLISKYGIDCTKNFGTILCTLGACGLLLVSLINDHNVNMICATMALVAAGSALMGGTFCSKAMEIFPDMNGVALAMLTALRQIFAFGLIILSEVFFDGTILPVAILIFICTILAVSGYLILEFKKNKY